LIEVLVRQPRFVQGKNGVDFVDKKINVGYFGTHFRDCESTEPLVPEKCPNVLLADLSDAESQTRQNLPG
jgi:hypothetical protein